MSGAGLFVWLMRQPRRAFLSSIPGFLLAEQAAARRCVAAAAPASAGRGLRWAALFHSHPCFS